MDKTPIKNINIRVNKSDSSFVYFILESNEGICFYSTAKSSLNQDYRDVNIYFTSDFENELTAVLKVLEQKFTINYL